MSVFYYCPWVAEPKGGIKQIHRHVEALVRAGVDACVLVSASHRPGWFDTAAPVAAVQTPLVRALREKLRKRWRDELWWLHSQDGPLVTITDRRGLTHGRRLDRDDILVLPEYLGKRLTPCAFGARVVVFNQNAHYTFWGFEAGESMGDFVYHRGAAGVLAVSDHNVEYLRHAFPDQRVYLTRNGIDVDRFHPREQKKQQIAYMPRKLPLDVTQVVQILGIRDCLKGWTLKPISNMNESQVAEVMRESAFFMSTCEEEGFGLPPLEAAACGCIVVGYHGQAAREFMQSQLCYPIDQGDILSFAVTMERLLKEYERDPTALLARAQQHSALVRERYSSQAEAEGVVRVWKQLLQPASPAMSGKR